MLPVVSASLIAQALDHPARKAPKRFLKTGRPQDVASIRFQGNNKPRLDPQRVKVISGRANEPLARQIADYFDLELAPITLKDYANGEIYIRLDDSVRGCDVFIVQSLTNAADGSHSVNDHFTELLLMVDAARRADARSITVVMPHYGYARADRRNPSKGAKNPNATTDSSPDVPQREAIGAKMVADVLQRMGADRAISVDMHASQLEGYFDEMEHLGALEVISGRLQQMIDRGEELIVVSPDAGGGKRVQTYADKLGVPLGVAHKERGADNRVKSVTLTGYTPEQIRGKTLVIIDDMIDTGGTITAMAKLLKAQGAQKVIAAATHAVLSGNAVEKLQASDFDEIIVTDTIPLKEDAKALLRTPSNPAGKLIQLSVAPVIGKTIYKISADAQVQEPVQPLEQARSTLSSVKNLALRFFNWLQQTIRRYFPGNPRP